LTTGVRAVCFAQLAQIETPSTAMPERLADRKSFTSSAKPLHLLGLPIHHKANERMARALRTLSKNKNVTSRECVGGKTGEPPSRLIANNTRRHRQRIVP